MERFSNPEYLKQMINQANKLNKISKSLESLSYKMIKENPYPLGNDEVYAYVCKEAAEMIDKATKHLTNNGTRYY